MQIHRSGSFLERVQRLIILDSGIAKPAVKVVGPRDHMRVHKKLYLTMKYLLHITVLHGNLFFVILRSRTPGKNGAVFLG